MVFLYRSINLETLIVHFKRQRFINAPNLHILTSSFCMTSCDKPLDYRNLQSSLSDTVKGLSCVNERDILNELSELLPVSSYNSISSLLQESSSKNGSGCVSGLNDDSLSKKRAIDDFLSPDEKLQGVFLQKLKGVSAIECALTNVGVNVTLDVFTRVVNKGNLGAEASLMLFKWAIKQPNISLGTCWYNVIIKALGRRKSFDLMVEILYEMRTNHVDCNLETLSIVMDGLIRARRVHKAIDIYGKVEDFGLNYDTESLNVLLQCLCRRSHVAAANSFLKTMKGKIPFDLATYNIMVGAWSRFGRVDRIERALEGMTTDGFTPNCLTFRHLIEGLGRAGRVDDAVKMFDTIKEQGPKPDVTVYNAIFANFAAVGKSDSCMEYFRLLLDSGCVPNMDTYGILISFFLKVRKVANGMELFDDMLGRGFIPSTGTLTSFIKPLCSFGPPHAAMIIYKKARKVGCQVSLIAYKLLLMRLSRFGKCGMMLTLWDEMQESGHSCDIEVYEYIINGLCNIGQLENAVLVMEEALHKGFCPSRLICSKLNNKLLASNNVERAYKLFLKIKEARRNENARKYWRSNGWHF